MVEKGKALLGRAVALVQWGLGLMISLILGTIADLFLNQSTRATAIAFQRTAFVNVSSFTPGELINQVGLAWSQTELIRSGPGWLRLMAWLVQFPIAVHRNLIAQGMLAKAIIYSLDVLALVAWLGVAVYLVWRNVREDGEKSVGEQIPGMTAIQLPFLAAAAAIVVPTVAISIALLILKWIAIAALYLFGWLTDLASLSAMVGSLSFGLYFIVLKASEKRLGELGEAALGRFVRRDHDAGVAP